jgi:hypothetical protein
MSAISCGHCGHAGAHANLISTPPGAKRCGDCPACEKQMANERMTAALDQLSSATAEEMTMLGDQLREQARLTGATPSEVVQAIELNDNL